MLFTVPLSPPVVHEYVKNFDEPQFELYEEQTMDQPVTRQPVDSTIKLDIPTPISDLTEVELGQKASVDSGQGSMGTSVRTTIDSCNSSCVASPTTVDKKNIQRSASEWCVF